MPIDDKIFKSINEAQWLWYFYMYVDETNEQSTIKRDLLEYHAGFLAPELVNKVREMREKESGGPKEGVIGTRDHQEFSENIGRLFGKSLEGEESGTALADSITERESLEQMNKNLSKYNYKYWLDFNLE